MRPRHERGGIGRQAASGALVGALVTVGGSNHHAAKLLTPVPPSSYEIAVLGDFGQA